MIKHVLIPTLTLVTIITSQSLFAQAVTVMGSSIEAQNCYTAAILSTRTKSASETDIDNCTLAITKGNLKKAHKAATFLNRGIIYSSLSNFDQAMADYEQAKELTPRKGEVYLNIGNINYIDGDYNKAIAEYSTAIKYKVKARYVAYTNRGMSYQKLGQLNEAEENYRKALSLSPNFAIAKQLLDELLIVKSKNQTIKK